MAQTTQGIREREITSIMSDPKIYQQLVTKKAKLAVIGLGYVGLPIALEMAKKISVIGFDIEASRNTVSACAAPNPRASRKSPRVTSSAAARTPPEAHADSISATASSNLLFCTAADPTADATALRRHSRRVNMMLRLLYLRPPTR